MTADMDRYKEFVISKCSEKTISNMELTAVLGMAGEAGEIADVLKKRMFHDHRAGPGSMVEELGDLFFYFTLMLEAYNYALDTIVDFNIRKLDERLPDGIESERSMNRGGLGTHSDNSWYYAYGADPFSLCRL